MKSKEEIQQHINELNAKISQKEASGSAPTWKYAIDCDVYADINTDIINMKKKLLEWVLE